MINFEIDPLISHLKKQLEIKNNQSKLMSIDYGMYKIGFAISTPDYKISFPLSTENVRGKPKEEIFSIIFSLIKENNICGLVVGMPYLDNYEIGNIGRQVMDFVEYINNKLISHENELIIFLKDERFSTKYAKTLLKMHNFKKKKIDEMDDKIAANSILESTLIKIREKIYSEFG